MIKINVQIIKKTFQLDKQGLLIQMKIRIFLKTEHM